MRTKKSPNPPHTNCRGRLEDINTEIINHLSFTIHHYFVLTNPSTVLMNLANSPLATCLFQKVKAGASSSTHIYAR